VNEAAYLSLTSTSGAPSVDLRPLGRHGKFFREDSGAVWFGRGLTMFMLHARFHRGEDIGPQCRWARSVGANYLRVFGPVPVPPWRDSWRFYSLPDPSLFSDLSAFCEDVGSFGLRVEFVPVCGPWSMADAKRLLRAAYEQVQGKPNVFIEWTNEPGQPGTFSGNLHTLGDGCNRHGILSATGVEVMPSDWKAQQMLGLPHAQHFHQIHWLDYGTDHLNDTQLNRYGRLSKSLKEIRDGDTDNTGQPMQGSGCPEWNDEGARVDDGDAYPDLETHVANTAIACLFGGSSLIHYGAGREANLPSSGGLEERVIKECARVWNFIPPEATEGSYTRGDFADFPIYWTPTDSTIGQSYGTWRGSEGWAVNPLPRQGWQAVAKPGITIQAGPRPWILYAQR
jgi:hypothetical protein